MSLLSNLRQRREARFATATLATSATPEEVMVRTVASVATVAVAITQDSIPTPPAAELPKDLVEAATHYCVELHGDGPEGVQAMLDDLRHYPSSDWPWLINHFRQQLGAMPIWAFRPPASSSSVRCIDCHHAIPTEHSAIMDCGLGLPSGLPIRGRWSTDSHFCTGYHAIEKAL